MKSSRKLRSRMADQTDDAKALERMYADRKRLEKGCVFNALSRQEREG